MFQAPGPTSKSVIDAVADGSLENVEIAAVGADKHGTFGVERSAAAGIETFVVNFKDYDDRADWNHALTEKCLSYEPDYVVSSGFMRIVGEEFINAFDGTYINTHPALLPSFPGAHGVRDAMAYGVKVTGCTVHIADAGVDTGPILRQEAVAILDDDTEETLHERIKVVERRLLIQTLADLGSQVAWTPSIAAGCAARANLAMTRLVHPRRSPGPAAHVGFRMNPAPDRRKPRTCRSLPRQSAVSWSFPAQPGSAWPGSHNPAGCVPCGFPRDPDWVHGNRHPHPSAHGPP